MGAASILPHAPPVIEWAVKATALNNAKNSGDAHVVVPFPEGTLVAVIDGLGHGDEAAVAAQKAADILAVMPSDPVERLINRCHKALHNTRGAVISLASFGAGKMNWIGVGNVEGVLFRGDMRTPKKRETLLLRGGVVGYQIPSLRAAALPVFAGDTLIFVSDGVDGRFGNDLPLDQPPDVIATTIFSRHAKGTDDALVFVARYIGPPQ